MSESPATRRYGWHWLALGLAVIITGVVYVNLEWVEITTDQGPGAEALRNPYLAADLYLERLGVRVERQSRLSDVAGTLGDDDTLVMTTSRATLGDADLAVLLGWIDDGGHAVVLALNEYDPVLAGSADPLLDHLGVRLIAVDGAAPFMGERMTDVVGTVAGTQEFCAVGGQPADVNVDGERLRVQFSQRQALQFDGDPAGIAASPAGTQLLQIGRGQGLVTVVTTTAMWRNALIRCHDNAHLLGVLLGDSTTVWWLAGVEMPPLYELLWRHFKYALLGVAAALLLWAWHQAFRFGATHGARLQPRRSLLEHVRAGAGYYWRRGQADALLDFLRADVLARTGNDPRSPLLAAAARRANIDGRQLMRAMTAGGAGSRDEFLARVQALQRLRRVI